MIRKSINCLQHGTTLAVSLLMLFVVTLVGVGSIQVATMEEKMSANAQDKVTSFEAAETALINGESWLINLSTESIPYSDCRSQCIDTLDTSLNVSAKDASWWASNATKFSGSMSKVKTMPHYRIEYIRFVPDSPELGQSNPPGVYYYQVTSHGSGLSDTAITLLQTVAARRF